MVAARRIRQRNHARTQYELKKNQSDANSWVYALKDKKRREGKIKKQEKTSQRKFFNVFWCLIHTTANISHVILYLVISLMYK